MSFGSQKSSSKSTTSLFGPDKLMLDQQKQMWGTAAPSLLDKAMQGGYSPGEKGAMFTRLTDPINASYRTGMEDLREEFARSGLTGGAASRDIQGLLGKRMQLTGEAAGRVEDLSRDEERMRMDRLMEAMLWHAPALTGGSSTSSGKGYQIGLG